MEIWITIAVLILCLILKKKIENSTVKACILVIAFFASLYFFSLLDFNYFFSFLASCGVTFVFMLFGDSSTDINSNLDLSNSAVAALIDEAIEVINDMLEVGTCASLYSYSYNGLIVPTPSAIPPFGRRTNYRMIITMNDIDNLQQTRDKYPKLKENPNLQSENEKLDIFLGKYGHCYNVREHSYIYETRCTVALGKNDKHQQELRALLYQQIKQRCPLADFHAGLLYSKTVARA